MAASRRAGRSQADGCGLCLPGRGAGYAAARDVGGNGRLDADQHKVADPRRGRGVVVERERRAGEGERSGTQHPELGRDAACRVCAERMGIPGWRSGDTDHSTGAGDYRVGAGTHQEESLGYALHGHSALHDCRRGVSLARWSGETKRRQPRDQEYKQRSSPREYSCRYQN